ncbi:MAG: penicillin-binding protein 1C [Gammaproteobacteria bacterium]|jgi:penicillin-binding protein 1C
MRLLKRFAITGLLLAASFLLLDRLFPLPLEPLQQRAGVVLDRHGDWLHAAPNRDGLWRFQADVARVDPDFVRVLLHYEDRRFYRHPGADPLAILRATGQSIASGEVVSGASTLTMQVARLLERRPRTLASKLVELFRAFQLEWHHSKSEILGFYLTLAPYGGNLEGIEAGTRAWFDKPPAALTLAESALLAVLPQRPARLRPDRYPDAARQARDKVLGRLLASGLITQQQHDEAAAMPVPRRLHRFPRHAPHYSALLLRREAAIVRSTIDGPLQRQIEALAKRHAVQWEKGVTMAALVLDNASGEVRAWLGSHDLFDREASGYVDMVTAVRSPGSTLKPFIYGIAFDSNLLHPETLLRDAPRSFGSYTPTNFDGRYRGDVSVIEALQQSLNIPAVSVLDRLGPGRLADAFGAAGIDLRIAANRPELPMALGGAGLTLEELARLYRLLALSSDPLSVQPQPLLGERAAGWVTKILAENPPPARWRESKRQLAWKTGTSYGYRDAWTIGFDRELTAAVWVGRPDGHPRHGDRERTTGRRAAAPLFFEIMGLLPERSRYNIAADYGEPPPGLARFDRQEQLMRQPLELRLLSGGERIRPADACAQTVIDLAVSHGESPYHWFLNGAPAGRTTGARQRVSVPEPGNLELQVMDASRRTASLSVWIEQPGCLRAGADRPGSTRLSRGR